MQNRLESVEKIHTLPEILTALEKTKETVCKFYSELPVEFFYWKPTKGWTAKENVKHLIFALWSIEIFFSMKLRFTLFIFGKGKKESRSFTEIQKAYLAKLKAGAGAGLFTPIQGSTKLDKSKQEKLCQDLETGFNGLIQNIKGWTEEELDEYRIIHPIIGILTVREMLFFSIYHCYHHSLIVEGRYKERN